MQKTITLLITLFFAATLTAGKTNILGNWIITKVESKNDVSHPYQTLAFMQDGTLKIMGIPVGTWELKAEKLYLKTNVFEKKNENYDVTAKGNDNLILSNKEKTMYLQKMDKTTVAENNKKSGLAGKWKINGDYPEMIRIFDFVLPDSLTVVENEPGVTSSYIGSWVYNPNDKSLILMMMGTEMRGKYNMEKIDDELILKNEKFTLKGKPVNVSATEIKHLNFTEEDFYDADGNYKYDADEEKLPWQEPYSIIENLIQVEELVYRYSDFLPEVNVPKQKILKARVTSNPDNVELCVDYIFDGYDNENLPEDTQLTPNCYTQDSYNKLFPFKGDTYRVAGTEQITTPAGTFNCTVIDVAGDFDAVSRLWLINDMPGIIAKIIREKKDDFGYYKIFELEKIINPSK